MKNILTFALSLTILLSSCLQFKTTTLYDGVAPKTTPPRVENLAVAVEPVIFDDDGSNFWVTDDPNCTTGSVVTDVVHSGDAALKINWNRDPAVCKWAGFGIGWDNWAGKDLSEIVDYAAFEMYVRSQEGKMFSLPIVLTLEDYSGNMGWSFTGNGYFEKYFIDEEWQKITVPLSSFDLSKENPDLGNIKQLSFELLQEGGIYLDDVRLVFYDPEPEELWLPEVAAPEPAPYPVQLFDDSFINDNGWGIFSDHCQDIQLTSDNPNEGQKAIHAKWDDSKEDCYFVQLGASWNKWYVVDMSDQVQSTYIELDVKSAGGTFDKLPVWIGFEDYERRMSGAQLQGKYLQEGKITDSWQRARIPIADAAGNGLDFADIKQFVIYFEEEGELFLDNIRLVRDGS
jgi:hypothetical protein